MTTSRSSTVLRTRSVGVTGRAAEASAPETMATPPLLPAPPTYESDKHPDDLLSEGSLEARAVAAAARRLFGGTRVELFGPVLTFAVRTPWGYLHAAPDGRVSCNGVDPASPACVFRVQKGGVAAHFRVTIRSATSDRRLKLEPGATAISATGGRGDGEAPDDEKFMYFNHEFTTPPGPFPGDSMTFCASRDKDRMLCAPWADSLCLGSNGTAFYLVDPATEQARVEVLKAQHAAKEKLAADAAARIAAARDAAAKQEHADRVAALRIAEKAEAAKKAEQLAQELAAEKAAAEKLAAELQAARVEVEKARAETTAVKQEAAEKVAHQKPATPLTGKALERFQEANSKVVKKVMGAAPPGHAVEHFDRFRALSQQFEQGKIPAANFHLHLVEMKLAFVVPDMIAALPTLDASLREQLLTASATWKAADDVRRAQEQARAAEIPAPKPATGAKTVPGSAASIKREPMKQPAAAPAPSQPATSKECRQPVPDAVFVRSIPSACTEDQLRARFSTFGQVKWCKIVEKKGGGRIAFIDFGSVEAATRAKEAKIVIDGSTLNVVTKEKVISAPGGASKNPAASGGGDIFEARPFPSLDKPSKQLAEHAEDLGLRYMRWLGFRDASRVGHINQPDGGVDVCSIQAVAQIKAYWHGKKVDRPSIQAFYGASSVKEHLLKQRLFFAPLFTAEAMTYAQEMGILVFSFDMAGQVSPENNLAKQLVRGRKP